MLKKLFRLDQSPREALKTLVACSLLVALVFLFDRVLGSYISGALPNWLALNLSLVPIMFAGFLYGPLWGGVVGAVGDVLCCLLMPMGPYHPGFTLSNFLVGFIAGVFIFFLPKLPYRWWGEALYCVPVSALVSVLNSLWLSQMYTSKTFLGWLSVRLPPALAASAVYTLLMFLLMRFVVTALKKARLV